VKQLNIVALKADKTEHNSEIDKLLIELGNPSKNIPFYAVFPGDGGDPIVYGEGILTKGKVIEMLEQAGPSRIEKDITATVLKKP